jgi:protein kinase C-binding protein NELL
LFFVANETFSSSSSSSSYFYSFSSRYLELQSSGRRNEIRFHFSYLGPKNELMVNTEVFPYRLADNKWHKLALSISGTEIQLIVDCHPLYRRVTHHVPDRNFSASNMQLFVGQRNSNSHSLFKVKEILKGKIKLLKFLHFLMNLIVCHCILTI